MCMYVCIDMHMFTVCESDLSDSSACMRAWRTTVSARRCARDGNSDSLFVSLAFLRVCMCVCVKCVCVYVQGMALQILCLFLWLSRVCVCMCGYLYTCINTCIHAYKLTWAILQFSKIAIQLSSGLYLYTHPPTHTHTHSHTTHTHTSMHARTYTYKAHRHTYMHT